MQNKTLSAGDQVESRCTKCRKVTNHIVIAMTGDTPSKVQCNTCEGQHKFRAPTAEPKKRAVRKPVDPKIAEQKAWDKLELDDTQAVAYSMDKAYKVGDVIKHKKFGLGQVQEIGGTRKIGVLFADGLKTMRCK
ncbi:MAG: hypothetical protein C0615_07945 [Desulfuromonas sp.]|nr:MAG: hypothetical protein C0615_07945 [Desulfuromonas sp.]